MLVHDLNDLIERQNGHPVRVVLHDLEVDTSETTVVTGLSPTDTREAGDAPVADVIEDTCSTENLGCRHPILRRTQALVQTVPGFENEGWNVVL